MKEQYEICGYHFARGVLKLICQFLCVWFVVLLLFGLFIPTDDSDVNWYNRSGMTIHTDNKTGLEYLSTPNGGLILREK